MNDESRLLMEIWERLDDYIPMAHKTNAAKAIFAAFREAGYSTRDFDDLEGEDEHIDAALDVVLDDDDLLMDEDDEL